MDPMTREQWQLETKRIYKDVSAEEVFESAEKLFKLWDGEDFTFGYADNEIAATQLHGFCHGQLRRWQRQMARCSRTN